MRTAVWPPSSPAGIIAVNSVEDAAVNRAGTPPIVTRGRRGSSGSSLPSIVTRPPSTAQSGWTAEMRDELTEVIDWRSAEDTGAGTAEGTRNSGFVEFHVPVEVIAPAVRGVLEADSNPDCRRPFRTFGHAYQVHAGLGRRTPALPAIAADTA